MGSLERFRKGMIAAAAAVLVAVAVGTHAGATPEDVRSAGAGSTTALGASGTVVGKQIVLPPRVLGYNVKVTQGATRTTPTRYVGAVCPNGQRPVGSGAQVVGGGGAVAITSVLPLTYMVTARAVAKPGFHGSWSLDVYAVCADPLPGLVVVHSTGSRVTSGLARSSATCPGGLRVLSVGGELTGGDGHASLDRIEPSGDARGGTVNARFLGDVHGSLTATTYLVCGPLPLGWQLVRANSPAPSTTVNYVHAICGPGRVALGVGVAKGNDSDGLMFVDRLKPNVGTPGSTTTRAQGNYITPPYPWSITAWATCASP